MNFSSALLLFINLNFIETIFSTARTFKVDWDNKVFLKDGEPFHYVSGSFHYSRVLPDQWKDRLIKMKAGGLNAVQTYVMWNFHSTEEHEFDFSGNKDLERFLKEANEVGLLVILRAGPYVCAEWEFGGFPWYLKKYADLELRSSNQRYLEYVDEWFDVLLPKMEPLLYENGGPIITVQFENEYGSYGICDKNYLQHLVTKMRQYLGPDVVLFTTDGDGMGYLNCGALKSELATVDFGITNDPESNFKPQRQFQPNAPLVNSEFYTGWLDHWGQHFEKDGALQVASSLDKILTLNASINMYMYVGSTNFAYWSGSNGGVPYNYNSITSYDYDSPISESGDTTWKYFTIKDTIAKYFPAPEIPVPSNSSKASLRGVKLESKGPLLNFFNTITEESSYEKSKYPKTMEDLGFAYGFVLYRTKLNETLEPGSMLKFDYNGLGDRVTVLSSDEGYKNSVYLGTLENKADDGVSLAINQTLSTGSYLVLIVENQGRVNYASVMQDQTKGLRGNVTLNDEILLDWEAIHLDLSKLGSPQLAAYPDSGPSQLTLPLPLVYQAEVELDLLDTFLNTTTFSKGVAFVNTFNLGRYWPTKGPQKTLYLPTTARQGDNTKFTLTLVEFENQSTSGLIDFLDYPILDGSYSG